MTELKLLNLEQIAARRVPLEEANVKASRSSNWVCHYCSKKFSSEVVFLKHACEAKRRALEMKSPLGQAAYSYFKLWFKLRRFGEQSISAFTESRFYRTFINFAQMVIDANISKPEKYVELMVEENIQPPLWCKDAAYAIYLDWYDRTYDPLQQVSDSIDYLITLTEKEKVPLESIFEHLGSQKVLALMRQRRLSPWFLYKSSKFIALLRKLDKQELNAFGLVANISLWAERFKKNKKLTDEIVEIVKGVGL